MPEIEGNIRGNTRTRRTKLMEICGIRVVLVNDREEERRRAIRFANRFFSSSRLASKTIAY